MLSEDLLYWVIGAYSSLNILLPGVLPNVDVNVCS